MPKFHYRPTSAVSLRCAMRCCAVLIAIAAVQCRALSKKASLFSSAYGGPIQPGTNSRGFGLPQLTCE